MRKQLLLLLGVLDLTICGIQKIDDKEKTNKILFQTSLNSVQNGKKIELNNLVENQYLPNNLSICFSYDSVDEETFVQEYGYYDREKYLAYLRNYYTSRNTLAIRELGIEEYVIDMSSYSPYVFLDIPSLSSKEIIDQAYILADNAIVKEVGLLQEYVFKTLDLDCESILDANDLPQIASTDVPRVAYDNYPLNCPYTGFEVCIGILEPSSLDVNDSRFDNITAQVVLDTVSSNDSSHGTDVAAILGGQYGVASGASIYFADVDSRQGLLAIENLITSCCNVINMSFGMYNLFGDVMYDESLEGYLDYISNTTNVIMVAGCGNGLDMVTEQGFIPLPAAAANVIAVGSCRSDGDISAHSIYAKNDIYTKPNLVATGAPRYIQGSGYVDGTSFAAPAVTGTIALLLEVYDYNLNQQQALAILSATANKDIITYDPVITRFDKDLNYVDTITVHDSYQFTSGTNIRSGAGMLDIAKALNSRYGTVEKFNFLQKVSLSSGVGTHTVGNIYCEAGEEVIVGVCFERNAYSYNVLFQTLFKSKDMPNYIIEVVNPSNQVIISNTIHPNETTMFANIKMLEFQCSSSGNYKINIQLRGYPETHDYRAFKYSYPGNFLEEDDN